MEHAFGIIPLRRCREGWETLLVKHQKGHWAFPKGHQDGEETPQEVARRELEEETALRVVHFLPGDPLQETYVYTKEGIPVDKTVIYFLAEVEGDVVIQEEEIATYRWLSFEDAQNLATFPQAKKLSREAAQRLFSV